MLRTISIAPSSPCALLLAGVTFALAGCSPVDLRPDSLRGTISAEQTQKGRQLLSGLAERYGFARWQSLGTTNATLTDTWPSFLTRSVAMPWPEDAQLMRVRFRHGTDNIRLDLLGGPAAGRVWGIQNWTTYAKQKDQDKPLFKEDSDIRFWLPTIAYFMTAPFRLQESTVVAYAGEATRGGQTYNVVLATWKKAEPQADVDQYILYIHKESGRLDYLSYTVRDFGNIIKGTMEYAEYRRIDGVLVPFLMTVRDQPEDVPVHQMYLRSISFGETFEPELLVPDPTKNGKKNPG